MRSVHIKILAHRLIKGWAIPLFDDNGINRAIEDCATKIRRSRTFRRRPPPEE
jgi:hypothetical protein